MLAVSGHRVTIQMLNAEPEQVELDEAPIDQLDPVEQCLEIETMLTIGECRVFPEDVEPRARTLRWYPLCLRQTQVDGAGVSDHLTR